MAGYRANIQLFIPEKVWDKVPIAKKIAFRDIIREMKSYACKINEGLVNEEMTVKATWHRCVHDEGGSCPPEQDI